MHEGSSDLEHAACSVLAPRRTNGLSELFRMAAVQDLPEAQAMLGFCYEAGRGVGQDFNEAATLYRKPSAKGVAFAQFRLGVYSNGGGVFRRATLKRSNSIAKQPSKACLGRKLPWVSVISKVWESPRTGGRQRVGFRKQSIRATNPRGRR